MTYALRALGWLIFGAGVLIFIFTGGIKGIRSGDLLPMIGCIMMPLGMIVTSAVTMISSWKAVRRGKDQAE